MDRNWSPSSSTGRPSKCDEGEEDRNMLTTAASINSLESRPFEDASSLTMIAREDLKQRRFTLVNSFRVGSTSTNGSVSAKPSTGMRVYRGRSSVPYLIEKIALKRASQLHQMACEALENDKHIEAISHLTKAVVLDADNGDYFTLRGEAYLQISDFQSAILSYKRACILQPENELFFRRLAFIHFLQGQAFFDEENYEDALDFFSKAVEIRPDSLGFHMRSIACLAALNRHGECLALVNKRLSMESDNADLYVMRARIHDAFRNDSLCYFDVVDALKLNPDHKEAMSMLQSIKKRCNLYKLQAMRFDLLGKRDDSIAKVSSSIEVDPSVPDLHVYRSALLRRNHDFIAAADDLLIAMDKTGHDESNPVYKDAQKQLLFTYNDFAVQCFKKGYYNEAVTLLNKAIKGEKTEKTLYMNRGDCFYRTKELHFALSDYLQALDLDPVDSIVKFKLANVYNDLGITEYEERRYQPAEEFFSVAISYDPRISSFYASRARARYMLENLENAKIDVLSALHINCNNKDVTSLFTRLFPGSTTLEAMTSQLGEMVGVALTEVISEVMEEGKDVIRSFSPKTVLPGIKKQLTCSGMKSPEESLKPCLGRAEIEANVIKGKKKVNELVELVMHSRQSLEHTGPRLKEHQLLAIELPSWVETRTASSQKNEKAINPVKK